MTDVPPEPLPPQPLPDGEPGGTGAGDVNERLTRAGERVMESRGATLAEAEATRYRSLFEHAPCPLFVTDFTGVILKANASAASLLGIPASKLERKPLTAFTGDRAAFSARLATLVVGEVVTDWETELLPRARVPIPATITAWCVERRNPGGGEIHWLVQDLRARLRLREQERALHREQSARATLERVAQRSGFLSEATARLMGVLDPAEIWRAAAELAGEQEAASLALEMEGDNRLRVRGLGGSASGHLDLAPLLDRVVALDADPGDIGPLPFEAVRIALAGGEPEIAAPESESAHACVVVPIRVGERAMGALVTWLLPGARIAEEVIVARSFGERVAVALESAGMFQEMVRTRRAAEEARKAETDLLSVVSHEMRTPLTAIVSYAELLHERSAELPEKLAHYAERIAAAADQQRCLVDQILAYRDIQRQKHEIELEDLDYSGVARTALAMVEPQIGSRKIELRADLPHAPLLGVCDRRKLQEILANLLANAIRHTSRGHVRLALAPEGEWVIWRIEDTGEGIPADALPNIFNRFWRGPNRERSGSGLGLTITRDLVHYLRGSIDVESDPGVGTTFTIRLPRIVSLEIED